MARQLAMMTNSGFNQDRFIVQRLRARAGKLAGGFGISDTGCGKHGSLDHELIPQVPINGLSTLLGDRNLHFP